MTLPCESAGRGLDASSAMLAMAASGHEVIVGVTRDLQFGHAVMFGMGGTLVEILRDVSFRIVPFSEEGRGGDDRRDPWSEADRGRPGRPDRSDAL